MKPTIKFIDTDDNFIGSFSSEVIPTVRDYIKIKGIVYTVDHRVFEFSNEAWNQNTTVTIVVRKA
jgi:hypothetical protein